MGLLSHRGHPCVRPAGRSCDKRQTFPSRCTPRFLLQYSMMSRHHTALSVLGESLCHGRRARIGITQTDRLGHMWVLGKTGAGKSTLLTNLIYADMQAG